ncbi:hypothetical protein [Kaistia nematophila]|uniref:Autotransporter domain-containing protein n=1 Tax=Kaistia nematophila TaxID=2994654 RepID=A0A9X3E5E8_9HYPH|nr:hypothetical protein [Kaistia nematophila]MCX5571707.1 hypothetical protein [Kaistia nematophila]
MSLLGASDPAAAACVGQTGNVMNCTGDANGGSAVYTAPSVTTLNVNSLTSNLSQVSLTGTGSSPIDPAAVEHYTCAPPAQGQPANCTITPAVPATDDEPAKPETCAGANCIAPPAKAASGPTGNAGPTLIVNYTPGANAANGVVGGNTDGVPGVIAQSNGSRGGNGSNGYVFSNGGDGGNGADGGNATVNANGNVTTSADHAAGIVATSMAGNGGNGGGAYGISGSAGDGGLGGSGGTATVNFIGGHVITTGDYSVGIAAVSQGGGGGNGGGGGGLVFNPGGGNAAGSGGNANVTTSAGTSISTSGIYSHGIVAQSIGGGGGGSAGGFGLFSASGGSGGNGGNGGIVHVVNGGSITTTGDYSQGILAQTIGGGGGDGGSNFGLFAGSGSGAPGGNGGPADVVTVGVTNSGAIETYGVSSNGILAQSIGGGGGNGGRAGGLVALGGNGSATSDGGIVEVTNTSAGSIKTHDAYSAGILAQSIGGGGGNGGVSAGLFTAGGTGGKGGDGSRVTVINAGDIETGIYGADSINSAGIFAQSVGGGGGNGGGAFSGSAGVSVALGGTGGDGGEGKTVEVLRDEDNARYSIITHGDQSDGVFAQSIGGGGGNGGFAVSAAVGDLALAFGGDGGKGGDGGEVTVETAGTITTEGAGSRGIFAQSIGGGGGNGGGAIAVAVGGTVAAGVSIGGTGGEGGDAKAVNVSSWSDIKTKSDNAQGIVAQSVGGGGGNGGYAISGAIGGLGVAVGIGGAGSSGGAGLDVDVDSSGSIWTKGNNSTGILAQSVGGGGGNGGFVVAGAIGGGAVSVGLGGEGGSGSSAGEVTVNADGAGHTISTTDGRTWNMVTEGDNAVGILAQSVGGGGGNGGFAGSLAAGGVVGIGVSLGGSGGGGGDAAKVTVNNGKKVGSVVTQNNILTMGDGSSGIVAQSIGGGGGNGGFAVTLSASGSYGGAGGAAAVSLGGSGATGGVGKEVFVTNYGNIATGGQQAHGILAQSIGGGGGNGGFSIAGTFTSGALAASVAIGGSGGAGQNGGEVTVGSTGNIETRGDQSIGIFAQSVGGGGGNGGFAGAGAIALQGGSVGVGLGGSGEGGGAGVKVAVTSTGNVTTGGDQSIGILAQSVGGGGGNGGSNVTLALGQDAGIAVGLGGDGDIGGAGGVVTVTSTGNLTTGYDFEHGVMFQGGGSGAAGILAQSVGGGGGNGGFSAAVSGGKTLGVSVSLGGSGKGGGQADIVTVSSEGNITTGYDSSAGILAQSVGGGGGNGGFSGVLAISTDGGAAGVSLGGSGGTGGIGEAVTVTSNGNIRTLGNGSDGILAQSVGGGGGNGGASIAASGSGKKGSVSVSLGGGGGDGGISKLVTVNNTGTIWTKGDISNGILAQSVAGGGGNGGFSVAGNLTVDGMGGASVSIGGGGGEGQNAGAVIVNSNVGATLSGNAATIHTEGGDSNGIFAQSVGGGGGNGGFSGAISVTGENAKTAVAVSIGGFGDGGGNGSTVNVNSVDNILTEGNGSNGIFAQSVGGGGGNGGFSFVAAIQGSLGKAEDGTKTAISASLGGFGAAGGNGDAVTVDSTGLIQTKGKKAYGVLAQSIGGGGGNGGLSVSASLSGGEEGRQVSASVGGFGADGGYGGTVTVTRNGSIITEKDQSVGIFAQSVGGGGGNGGLSVAGVISGKNAKSLSASLGGFGGEGSYGGTVTVDNTGSITTGGVEAHAIQAQSIGGGGGNGGMAIAGTIGVLGDEGTNVNASVAVGGFGGDGGIGGLVKVDNDGLLTTTGDGAYGIFAQSIGGGGGSGGNAVTGVLGLGGNTEGTQVNISVAVGGLGGDGNLGGDVHVTQDGGIETSGVGATGIFAQSIGGGGGTGGRSNSISLQLGPSCKPPADCDEVKKSPNWNLQATVGGEGGVGNIGGLVEVTNLDFITTHGDKSAGILAQSIGGGGGTGGDAYVGLGGLVSIPGVPVDPLTFLKPVSTGSFKRSAAVGIGGTGGTGGNGGTVTVTNTGHITTEGQTSDGIHAQSVGGGGGDGGDGNAGMLGTIALGGSGGASGNGGAVTVTNGKDDFSQANVALIETFGGIVLDEDGERTNPDADTGRSNGIFAQSVGGGGGSGGGAGALLAIGGTGEAAGYGGTVTVDNYGGILTHADDSAGIFAQSIGGGGGAGGSIGLAILGVGGSGGSAGVGGAVGVTNAAMIETHGLDSHAIFAQSVGGGGGSGGGKNSGKFTDSVPALVLIGGAGGSSGNGGAVTVTNSNSLHTLGDGADGINAQSIGGGGGSGGRTYGLLMVGGDVASTGNGGDVTVENQRILSGDESGTLLRQGNILVEGYGSHGIFAQSVGGGGGNAGGGFAASLTSGSLGVGGAGGGGGGVVKVTNAGTITTTGDAAVAIFAQSIGGGGGNGAMTGGTALADGSTFDFVIGGAGGASGKGGDVTVTNEATGLIHTTGYGSTGILAQSVGGGGGTGGITYVTSPGDTPSIALAIGGSGGAGGDGGIVKVINDGNMLIEGDNSVAIFAQSVGGGGGAGGAATAVALGGTAVIGGAGVTGKGGDVIVDSTGVIELKGNGSVGIFAQSVGGGGGVVTAGTDGIVEATANGGTGNGGIVKITGNTRILITGDNSVGVFAQSVGGGGGVGGFDGNYLGLDGFSGASAQTFSLFSEPTPAGFMGSVGGDGYGDVVSLTQKVDVAVTGKNSFAILAQSVGGDGNGDIDVTIEDKVKVIGGSEMGAGVGFKDGKTNKLTNKGIVTSVDLIDGYAMRATGGDDTFENEYVTIGSVALGEGQNAFNNRFDAIHYMGDTVDLGATGKYLNEGYMSPGDWDRVMRTTLTGNLEQTEEGAYLLDLDLAGTTDRIDVSGTAVVDGIVAINVMHPASARTGSTDYVIIHTEEGVTDEGLELDAAQSAVAQYKLLYPVDPQDVVLNVDINYARGGMTENQTAVGSAINAIQTDLASPDFAPIAAALFYVPTIDALGAIYDSISGEGVSGFQQPEFDMNSTFLAAMTGQADSWRIGMGLDPSSQSYTPKALGYADEPEKSPAFAALDQAEERRWKIWATVGGNSGNVNGDPTIVGSADLTYKAGSLAAGVDYQVDPDTLMGLAVGGAAGSFSVPDRETSGNMVGGHLGAYGAKKWGQFYANGALALDIYDNSTRRQATVPGSDAPLNPVPGFSERWEGDFLSGGFSARAETGWRQPVAGLGAVTGFAGLQFASLTMQGFQETSPNGDVLGLDYDRRTITSLPSMLGLQFDTTMGLGENTTIQPWARAAWQHEFNPDRSVNPSFLAAPGYPFVVQGAAAAEDALAVNAGFRMNWGPDTSFFATFDGKFADNVQTYGGNAGFQVRW